MSMHHYTHRLTPVDHTHNRKALIIGGGIGGLATAIALTQIGFTVEVFERVTLLREVGAGLSLWANAIKALDYLGLASAVRALALSAPPAVRYSCKQPMTNWRHNLAN
jgi:2-polyprenyl-6-methoxyphenol hydroxylase-like FAD-dependent oxidoreductase